MAHDYPAIPADQHDRILQNQILQDSKYTQVTGGHTRPKAIILAGQPGAGKGGLARMALSEMDGNAAVIDADDLRSAHPDARTLRGLKPYTWSGETHSDASRWAQELRADAVAQRKNLVLDTTMPRADVIKDLQAKGYDVEIRAVAAHRLESELGVDKRFTDDLDRRGHGRYVPQEVRSAVYEKLPGTLDDVVKQTGVPVQVYDREGRLHFDSRTSPKTSPGQALETSRSGRLTQERLNDLHQSTDTQRQWHRDLPERVPNERVSDNTASHLLEERRTLAVEPGVQRLHNEVGGHRAVRPTVKAAGVLGTAYGAFEGKQQIDAAIDTARSNREQWVRGSEETVNQGTKAVVTGTAATVGAIPGAAAGTLTSPVTGPVGPVVGGLATGGAAAYGAEKLYEESRLQQWSKALGREVGELGYDHVSREGRLLRQVNGLKEDLQNETDPAKRAQLQTRLNATSETFAIEAERNGRYFEGRAGIDKVWEQTHATHPKVDKNDIQDALAKHIVAGKRPADAVRGALSDAVHEKYPRALPHQPVENYRALSNEQLAAKHGQYVGEVAQGRKDVMALGANKDSHNNIDQGWPKALAQQRQAGRVQDGLNELWRDTGHLGAIRESMHERGMKLPELPAELRPKATSTSPRAELSPQQERHHQLAQTQLGPALSARGHSAEQVDRVSAAAVGHAQQHAHRGDVRAFHLSKDGERVAVVQERAPISEFSVKTAQSQTADQHLERAHAVAQTQAREQTQEPVQVSAPLHEAPQRAMA
jgi:predicted ABC-type ATPase